MESKGFLMIFSDLASGSEKLIRPALTRLEESLKESSDVTDTVLGKITTDLKYTLDRLLKGLTGSKVAKIGFSVALTMIFRGFQLKLSQILQYFDSLDHSGISPYQVMVGQVLVYTCIIRAGKSPAGNLTAKVSEIFQHKTSLKEISGVALAADPSRPKLSKVPGIEQDVNLLMVNYASAKADSVLNQAGRHKLILFKGSYKVLPRLHWVWRQVVAAAVELGKETHFWEVFVEKEIVVEDKKRDKKIYLAFKLFQEFRRQGADLTGLMSTGFWNVWQDNLFNKKFRDHEIAVSLKNEFLAYVEKFEDKMKIMTCLLQLAEKIKVLDFIKNCFEKIIEGLDKPQKKWLIKQLLKFNSGKRANFTINILHFICKSTPELHKLCMKKLLRFSLSGDQSADAARIKVLNLASDLNLSDMVLKFFRQDSEFAGEVLNQLSKTEKLSIEDSESQPGKRKPGDLSVITQSQLEELKKVARLLAIEGILYENSEDFMELSKVLKQLVSGKSKDLNDLMVMLLSSLTKPVGYMRFTVGKVFKAFVNEVSEEFLNQLCKIVETGQFTIESQAVEEETNEETPENDLLNVPVNTKIQEKNVRDSFLNRATEFLEIIIKKSSNTDHKLKVYESLLLAFRSASRNKSNQNLVSRIAAILNKIHKKDLKITENHKATVKNLLISVLKSINADKNIGRVLSKNMTSLLNLLQTVDKEDSDKIINDLIVKFFEKHSSSLKLETFIEIFSKSEENPDIFNKILNYVSDGRNPNTQTHASEVVKILGKIWKLDSQIHLKKVVKCIKKVEKSEIKLKVKNLIEKNLLCAVLALKRKVDLVDSEVMNNLEELQKSMTSRNSLHGLFIQILGVKNSE